MNHDGSITVNAAHQYLIGPFAVGDIIIGQVVCGITPTESDLGISLSDAPDPVAAGGEVTYTADVTNAGPDDATGVTVLTSLPKGARLVSASGAACTLVKRKNAGVRCDLGTIASGGSNEFTMVVKVGGKPVTATSTVSSNSKDPSSGNNTDSETTQVAP